MDNEAQKIKSKNHFKIMIRVRRTVGLIKIGRNKSLRVVHTQAITFFLKSMSERGGSDTEGLD